MSPLTAMLKGGKRLCAGAGPLRYDARGVNERGGVFHFRREREVQHGVGIRSVHDGALKMFPVRVCDVEVIARQVFLTEFASAVFLYSNFMP